FDDNIAAFLIAKLAYAFTECVDEICFEHRSGIAHETNAGNFRLCACCKRQHGYHTKKSNKFAPFHCHFRPHQQRILWAQTDTLKGAPSAAKCPLWVRSGHFAMSARRPLYPQKRTWFSTIAMSALCQKRTQPSCLAGSASSVSPDAEHDERH